MNNHIKELLTKNFGKILLTVSLIFFLIFSHVTGFKGISIQINLNMNYELKEANPPTQQYHNVKPKKLQRFS